jgi:hypothetical protein
MVLMPKEMIQKQNNMSLPQKTDKNTSLYVIYWLLTIALNSENLLSRYKIIKIFYQICENSYRVISIHEAYKADTQFKPL